MTLPLALILGWLALTTAVGVLAGLRRAFSMEEFFVAGRSFGMVLFYTTAAAEIYSAFAFLGLAGWAYSKGVSVLYGLAYGSVAYGLFFFLGPRINRLGRRRGYITQPDYFEDRYGSPALGLATALVGVVFIIPYLQLQLMGTGMIVQIASGGAMGWKAALLLAAAAMAGFVFVSGLRGIGWTNLLQAGIMLGGMIAVGWVFPRRFFGGWGPMFEALEQARPAHLTLPDSGGLGLGWYTSTVLLCGLGMFVWPHIFAATYSAKNERVVRRNAGVLPLYQLAMLPVVIVGFTCAARAAGDPVFAAGIDNPDHAMLVTLAAHFPGWLAGLIGAGGVAAAISTASAIILTACNLIARHLVQRGVWRRLGDEGAARLGRGLVPAVTALAVFLALAAPDRLVSLLLMGYSGIGQFVPGILFGIFSRRPTRAAVAAGLGAGLAVALAGHLFPELLPLGVHPGFAGLLVNTLLVAGLSPFTRPVDPARLESLKRALE